MPWKSKGGLGICKSKANAHMYIEYNCMNPDCYAMWDLHESQEPLELCPYCGSNDIHSMRAPKTPRHNEERWERNAYPGADIYDQYGRY